MNCRELQGNAQGALHCLSRLTVVQYRGQEVTLLEREASEYAHHAIELASEKQASDILLLDIRGLNSFADFFVLLTADTRRQMSALAEDLDKALSQQGARLHHREGSTESGWVLLDFGDMVIHIFAPEERQFYQLELIWAQAMPLVRIQ